MASLAKNILENLNPVPKYPDGTWSGVMGGYVVKFDANGENYEFRTKVGIRTMRADCTVTVTNGIPTANVGGRIIEAE